MAKDSRQQTGEQVKTLSLDEHLALVGVLQELTHAALALFDPRYPLDKFLHKLAARFTCRVVLLVETGPEAGAVPRLGGAAGLSSASRNIPLAALSGDPRRLGESDFPFPETMMRKLHRWVVPVPKVEDATTVPDRTLVLFFNREPRFSRQYRGMLNRLARTFGVALHHRAILLKLIESKRALLELTDNLEMKVAERTKDLAEANRRLADSLEKQRHAQEQLVQAGKMAAVGTLVAGLSHELNNPIGVILGYVQSLLRRTPQTHASRPALEAIERQAKRAGGLIASLLDFSRKSPGVQERIQPKALILRVRELTAAQARSRTVDLEVKCQGEDLAPVKVNSHEIESALLDLVTNAIDATPPGGKVELEVVRRRWQGRPGVEFRVLDTGSGIPPHELPRVFDPFFTTKPVGQGTGLGLSIARQIVEAHGGRIFLESRAAGGTGAFIWLPQDGEACREVERDDDVLGIKKGQNAGRQQ